MLFDKYSESVSLFNSYGPTETTVVSGVYRITASDLARDSRFEGSIPIGRPISNTSFYILSPDMQVLPVGAVGELYIGGAGVALGYFGNEELTNEKFVSNPFSNGHDKLYRTGDLAKYLPDGNLEFFGRSDDQVKIRGFRVELTEIESSLKRAEFIKDCAVIATEIQKSVMSSRQLVAYIVKSNHIDSANSVSDSHNRVIASCKEYLASRLPSYMVPAAFIVMEDIPLTPNGKIDRLSLPSIGEESFSRAEYAPPRTPIEHEVCNIWREVLEIERVGVLDNFFDLGGHSLLAARVISHINQTFSVSIPVKTFFENPVPEMLAKVIWSSENSDTPPLSQFSHKAKTIPLSYAQQRLWMVDQIGGDSSYNLSGALKVSGALDLDVLMRSFSCIVDRHESLRTCFLVDEDGEPYQHIQDSLTFNIIQEDFGGYSDAEREHKLSEFMEKESTCSFDLSSDMMLRVYLIRLSEFEHVLFLVMHHIAVDGWSIPILVGEIGELYTAFSDGRDNPLPPLKIQYADYACWQRAWLQDDVLDEQLTYWERQLEGIPVLHSLPLDFARPPTQKYSGDVYSLDLDSATAQALSAICHAQEATLFMGLHAAFSVFLSRYSNVRDIVVGSAIANREQSELSPLIGFFANTLVLRSDLTGKPSFVELLNQSKATLLDAYSHQQAPFEQVVERLQPERSMSHSPLFQIMLGLQNDDQDTLELPGLTLSTMQLSGNVSKFDMRLMGVETEEGLRFDWEYNIDLFNRSSIERMAAHFNRLLSSLLLAPEENVFEAAILDEEEKFQLLTQWNATQASYSKDKCIHELFEACAAEKPDATAVIYDGQELSYRELNERANQVARYLVAQDVKPNMLVGVCLERSFELVVGMLGILKSGAAYLPIDPAYPEDRIRYILNDSLCKHVLTSSYLLSQFSLDDQKVLPLDPELAEVIFSQFSTDNPDRTSLNLHPTDLAYAIYTSGSTGNPKGVLVEHKSLVNYVSSISGYCDDVSGSYVSTNICFDGTATSFWPPLTLGKYIKLSASSDFESLSNLADEVCSSEDAMLFKITPAHMDALVESKSESGNVSEHKIFVGGDVFLKRKFEELPEPMKKAKFFNHYGPSEGTVGCAVFPITGHVGTSGSSIPLGKPLQNTELLVLSAEGELCPVNVAGELYIGGEGVARGYIGNEELTAERFIPNPFHERGETMSSERLYRTGDLVRWLPDGNLEFLGRSDNQVKIRGFRIELGEVEQALSVHDGVQSALVLPYDSSNGDKTLVAYVVEEAKEYSSDEEMLSEQQVFIRNLRQHLSQSLPEYMVPGVYLLLEKFPLTLNGKVDYKSLPEPDMSQQQAVYVAPRTKTEELLCEVWQSVLGLDRIGIMDNFFQLGGHSLLVMKMNSHLQKAGIPMAIRDVFSAATLADLAASIDELIGSEVPEFTVPRNLIERDSDQITPEMLPLIELSQHEIDSVVSQIAGGVNNIKDIYPLGPLQEGILFHHRISERGDPYVTPWLLKLASKDAANELIQGLQAVVDRHDILRTAFLWEELSTPVQVVCRHVEIPVTWIELQEDEDLLEHMQNLCLPEEQRMDVRAAPLLSLRIGHNPHSEHCIAILQKHHLISDHVGLEIILKEYSLFRRGMLDTLPAPTPYREFIAHTLYQERNSSAEAYFKSAIGDIDEATVPFNLANVRGDGSGIEEAREKVPLELCQQIRSLAKELRISPAAVFHAAWAMVVGFCSGKDDVVFGTVVSGRLQGGVNAEEMLGVFVNTLPFRVKLNSTSARDLVRQVHETLQSLLPYEQTRLSTAQRCSGLSADTPLFSALLNYRHSISDTASESSAELTESASEVEYLGGQERTNYPFTLSIDDTGVGFSLDMQVDTSVGSSRLLSYMHTAIENLVKAAGERSTQEVVRMSLLTEEEENQLLVEWNNTEADFPSNKCAHELFEDQAAETPAAVALVYEEEQLTYEALNEKANRLAHYLVSDQKVVPDTLIGIYVERSLDMVIAILGIMKAGGAYVPLEPGYPEARLMYMVEDAGLKTIVTQRELQKQTPLSNVHAIAIDDPETLEKLEGYPCTNLAAHSMDLDSSNLAYVIYTSGSTGKPKGVMIRHHSLVNLAFGIQKMNLFGDGKRWGLCSSFAFDASLKGLSQLLIGRELEIISEDTILDPAKLIPKLNAVSVIDCTPRIVELWLEAGIQNSLPNLVIGGEAIGKELWGSLVEWQNRYSKLAVNVYGPTECTVDSSWEVISGDVPNIGRPLMNVKLLVLDSFDRLVPIGVPGELHIAGPGLAKGYLKNPQLTSINFVSNALKEQTLSVLKEERLYRSGDLVRLMPEGKLEYLGRNDRQVKIRGYRIELGEIENTIESLEEIKNAVVLKSELDDGQEVLFAYVVLSVKASQDVSSQSEYLSTLETHLSDLLPYYMCPSKYVPLEYIPLNSNGKTDLDALKKYVESIPSEGYVPPGTDTEERICQLCEALLNVDRVGIKDNFFHLGGHSILAAKLVSDINHEFGIELPLREIFDKQCVQNLGKYVDQEIEFLGSGQSERVVDSSEESGIDEWRI